MTNCNSSKNDTKQRVLTDLGIDIEGDFPDEIGEAVFNRALYSTNENSFITKDSSFFGKRCVSVGIIDICGNGQTDRDGEMKIRIEDFVCLRAAKPGEGAELIEPPVYFVATPMINKPVLVTFEISRRPADVFDALGLDINVRTWEITGEPKPRVRFQWRCCVKYTDNQIG
jgi:hypothetical protein